MATRQGSATLNEARFFDASWAGITEADEGSVISIPAHIRELSFQVTGTFGGGTFQLQGSNDNVNFIVLQDVGGSDIGSTTAKVWRFANPPRYLKPKATAGAAANVSAFIHGTAQ